MGKILTTDQKNIVMALEEMEKTPGRAFVKEYIEGEIKTREDILLGKSKLSGINIDEIKFSESSVIRGHLEMLYKIADYTDNIKKTSGVYQTT